MHVNKDGHDAIMESKMIHLYVGFTKIDRMNPSSKECTIVFIKYMTDSGDECKKYLAGLTVIDMDEDSKKLAGKYMKFDMSN